MFEVIGKIDGLEQRVIYNFENGEGSLEGDKAILFLVQWELDNKTVVGPVGQYMESDINNPLSVLFAIKKCFDFVEKVSGSIPEAESVPDGCIS
jgi:hypothetical protein